MSRLRVFVADAGAARTRDWPGADRQASFTTLRVFGDASGCVPHTTVDGVFARVPAV